MRVMNLDRRVNGLTLVELLVGIVVGMFVVAGAIAAYLTTVRGNTETLRSTKLNQEMRAVMDLMINDIRRAGYWGEASENADTDTLIPNPFAQIGSTNIAIFGGNCIVYGYDRNSDGVVDSTERYGFRLGRDPLNPSRIQMRTVGGNTSICTDGTWAYLTDPHNIANISLTFSAEGSQCLVLDAEGAVQGSWTIDSVTPCGTPLPTAGNTILGVTVPTNPQFIEIRQVQISFQGAHPDDPAIVKNLVGQVKIRNDRVVVSAP